MIIATSNYNTTSTPHHTSLPCHHNVSHYCRIITMSASNTTLTSPYQQQ
ncbi:hypothetical protein OIU79_014118 [Salix purpurea]|uniref:Uncharacterized protein n=1 Tax=Salix purpurea TaxID=77065 RepID=A0A9Q0SWR8_SALPP|nr:hypothetical protein OIU79_014118 [Salix purpurea]